MSDLVNRLRLGDTRLSRATLNEAADRIEALEEVLHLFADDENWRYGRQFDPNGSRFDGTAIARDALAPEQDK